jgi:adhesin transport system membrane fusion protein
MAEHAHSRGISLLVWLLLAALLAGGFWAFHQRIDQVVRASGSVIASSRVQIIQAVDGGVLASLHVREGDHVERGQMLATLDQTRVLAAARELELKLANLRAQAARLTAEATDAGLKFPDSLAEYPEPVALQRALFEQRRRSLQEELRTLGVAIDLAREEAKLVRELAKSGDVSRSEVIRAERALNEAEAQRINRRNKFLQEAHGELAKVEDEIAQAEQVLTQRRQQVEDMRFLASVPGIVKNVRVTTIGGVLRAGEELLQIVPVDDQLIVETKVRPAEIADIRPGLPANIRFDPYDYTLFGAVSGTVAYVSADTLQEESEKGVQTFYRVHVLTEGYPVTSQTGKTLDILPGMTAQVDIRTGQRSVLDYLLKPLRRTAAEAFGER